jgi:hypothetical protein
MEISEPTYVEVRCRLTPKVPGTDGIMTQILQEVDPALWRTIHGLIKIIRNKEEIPIDSKMGIVCPIYKKIDR